MRFDRSSHSSSGPRPRAVLASLVAGATVAIFVSFAPRNDHLSDNSAQMSASSALRDATSGTAPASNDVLELALRNIDGVTYHG